MWMDAEMIARADQSMYPYNSAHAKVFTNVFVSTSMQTPTSFFSCGHPTVGFLVGDRIVWLSVLSVSGRHDECL